MALNEKNFFSNFLDDSSEYFFTPCNEKRDGKKSHLQIALIDKTALVTLIFLEFTKQQSVVNACCIIGA